MESVKCKVAVPRDFTTAVKDIKLAILQARAKAAHLANAEALKLYFFVGGYISKKTRNAKWGSGAIDALSQQLQVELPGLRGFSPQHMRFMRQFFEAWASVSPIQHMVSVEFRYLPSSEMTGNEICYLPSSKMKRHLPSDEIRPLPMGESVDCQNRQSAIGDFPQRHHPSRNSVMTFHDNRSIMLYVTVVSEKRMPVLSSSEMHGIIVSSWKAANLWLVGRYMIMPDHIHFFCAPSSYPPPDFHR